MYPQKKIRRECVCVRERDLLCFLCLFFLKKFEFEFFKVGEIQYTVYNELSYTVDFCRWFSFLPVSLSLSSLCCYCFFYIIIDEAHVYYYFCNRGSLYSNDDNKTTQKHTRTKKNDVPKKYIDNTHVTRLAAEIKITNIYAKSCQQAYNKLHKEKKSSLIQKSR